MDEIVKTASVAACGNLTSLLDSNPFKTCIEKNPNEAYIEFADCTYDYCVNINNFDNAREMVCGHLENLAKICAEYNEPVAVDWRAQYCRKFCHRYSLAFV